MFYVPEFKAWDIWGLAGLRANDYMEICIMVFALFYIIKNIRGTRSWIIAKGCFVMLALYGLAYLMSFQIITYIANALITFIIIALVIMFQPELRKVLEGLGRKEFSLRNIINGISGKKEGEENYSKESINAIVKSMNAMSKDKTGALILIERESDLGVYESTGIPMHADITSQLIINAFEKNTPLHDGAMIIRGNRIASATCYLPLSDNRAIDKSLGTRHRAALGASEETDALILIVSEETGSISVAEHGKIRHGISIEELREVLVDSQKETGMFEGKQEPNFKKNIKTLLLSMVVGLCSWVFFTDMVNPTVTVSFPDIPVEIVNVDGIASSGYVYEVADGKTVKIDVTGRKSEVGRLTAQDFEAYADASRLSVTNSMNIAVKAKKNADISIDTHNAITTLSIEEATSIDCPVVARQEGAIKAGHFLAGLVPDTKTVTITGPKSVLKNAESAIALINVSQFDSDFDVEAECTVYDKNGDVMDLSRCVVSSLKVKVHGTVYGTKEVPLKVEAYDSSYEECRVEIKKKKMSKETATISAESSILDGITEIQVPIDTATAKNGKMSISVSPANYMPENVYCADDKEVEVSMELEKTATRTFALLAKDIEVRGGMADFTEKSYNIKVTCNVEDRYEDVTRKIKPFIDVTGLVGESAAVPVMFGDGANVKTEGTVANIILKNLTAN